MKIARSLIAGVGVGLCLCAIGRADNDQIPNVRNVTGPVVVRRVIVVRSGGDRVIYVRPAYPLHSALPGNRSRYSAMDGQSHPLNPEKSGSTDNDNHAVKALKTGHSADTSKSEQQADKDNKSADLKPEGKQQDARQRETNQSDDAGALDRLTVQAQKEEAIRLAEPGGIESR
jgi:hypothetical protein